MNAFIHGTEEQQNTSVLQNNDSKTHRNKCFLFSNLRARVVIYMLETHLQARLSYTLLGPDGTNKIHRHALVNVITSLYTLIVNWCVI